MVTLSKFLKAIATWLESRFPEKIQAAAVINDIAFVKGMAQGILKTTEEYVEKIQTLEKKVADHEKKITDLNDEMNRAKTYLGIKSRIVGNTSFNPNSLPPVATKPK